MSPWSNDEATTRHSAIGSTSGPSTSTADDAIAAVNVDFPLPLPMLIEASRRAGRMPHEGNEPCHGSKGESAPPRGDPGLW